MTRVCIAGAGIAGTWLAIALARRGVSVHLHEKREIDPDTGSVNEGGRSIALALSHRGLHALEALGLQDRAMALGRRLRGRRIHPREGETVFTAYDPTGCGRMLALSRAELYGLLHEAAAAEPLVERRFGDGLVEWMLDGEGGCAGVRVRTGRGSPRAGASLHFDALIGADGADSGTRRGLEKGGFARFTRRDFPLVYREIRLLPRGADFDPEALHIWSRGSMMLIGLPGRTPGGLDGTLFVSEDDASAWFRAPAELHERFTTTFADVAFSLAQAEDVLHQPRGRIYTVEGGPWHAGPVGLVGDAAHAMTPFLGQGMNCALEDCEVLLEGLGAPREPADFARAFHAFHARRATDADAIARLSVANLEEMMIQTQSPEYLHRKQLEATLATRFPQAFVPCYTAITFDRVRYARIWRLRQLQADLIDRLRGAGLDAAALQGPLERWVEAAISGYGRAAAEVMSA